MQTPVFSASPSLLLGVLVAVTIKHYIADFVLQTNWMARGKEQARNWLLPLVAHCLCHALFTLAITLAVQPRLWWLTLVDFGVHMAVDRAKSLIGLKTGWTPANARFWWLLGLDQCLHQLTAVGVALALCFL